MPLPINLIKVAMLYRQGRVLLCLSDFVILNDFLRFRNAVGTQDVDEVNNQGTRINCAVMIFNTNHPTLADFLKEFAPSPQH